MSEGPSRNSTSRGSSLLSNELLLAAVCCAAAPRRLRCDAAARARARGGRLRRTRAVGAAAAGGGMAGMAASKRATMRPCVLLLLCSASVFASNDFDVVVYGSSPAGIAAATAAGVLGLKVALYEPLPMIGGMGAAGNLALNDGGNNAEHTGLALNFTRANAQWYCEHGIESVCSDTAQVSHPESFVSEASFRKMLGVAGIGPESIKTDCRVLSVTTGGTPSKITSIKLLCEKEPITATVFIDASYDAVS
jgi:hypothetical protein